MSTPFDESKVKRDHGKFAPKGYDDAGQVDLSGAEPLGDFFADYSPAEAQAELDSHFWPEREQTENEAFAAWQDRRNAIYADTSRVIGMLGLFEPHETDLYPEASMRGETMPPQARAAWDVGDRVAARRLCEEAFADVREAVIDDESREWAARADLDFDALDDETREYMAGVITDQDDSDIVGLLLLNERNAA